MHRRLRLLGGGVLALIAQHVDAGQAEGAVGAHRVAQHRGLRHQRGLLQHVAGEHDAVVAAPGAAGVRKRRREPLGKMVVVVVARHGHASAGQLPVQLGQAVQQIAAVGRAVGVGQIVRPGQRHSAFLPGKAQRGLVRKMRLICKNGRHGLAELVAHDLLVALVRDLNKPVDGLLVQAVDVGLVVEPRILFVQLQIGRPHRLAGRGLVILAQTAIGVQLARRVQRHAVARDQPAVLGDLHVFVGREEQVPLAVLLVLGHKAARRA